MLIAKFILFLIALLVGLVKFLFLIKSNLLYLIPFIGCAIGLWWLLRGFISLIKNADKLTKLVNTLNNIYYLLSRKVNLDDPRLNEFFDTLALPPQEFKRKY